MMLAAGCIPFIMNQAMAGQNLTTGHIWPADQTLDMPALFSLKMYLR